MNVTSNNHSDAISIIRHNQLVNGRTLEQLQKSAENQMIEKWKYYSPKISIAIDSALERLRARDYAGGVVHTVCPYQEEEETVLWILPNIVQIGLTRRYFLIDHKGCLYINSDSRAHAKHLIIGSTRFLFDFSSCMGRFFGSYTPSEKNYLDAVEDSTKMMKDILRQIDEL